MTEQLHFHFSLSCIGEGNGNPLQYSCLENPRDVGAWWAAVCGVAQSQTRLQRLNSSSSSRAGCDPRRPGKLEHSSPAFSLQSTRSHSARLEGARAHVCTAAVKAAALRTDRIPL